MAGAIDNTTLKKAFEAASSDGKIDSQEELDKFFTALNAEHKKGPQGGEKVYRIDADRLAGFENIESESNKDFQKTSLTKGDFKYAFGNGKTFGFAFKDLEAKLTGSTKTLELPEVSTTNTNQFNSAATALLDSLENNDSDKISKEQRLALKADLSKGEKITDGQLGTILETFNLAQQTKGETITKDQFTDADLKNINTLAQRLVDISSTIQRPVESNDTKNDASLKKNELEKQQTKTPNTPIFTASNLTNVGGQLVLDKAALNNYLLQKYKDRAQDVFQILDGSVEIAKTFSASPFLDQIIRSEPFGKQVRDLKASANPDVTKMNKDAFLQFILLAIDPQGMVSQEKLVNLGLFSQA